MAFQASRLQKFEITAAKYDNPITFYIQVCRLSDVLVLFSFYMPVAEANGTARNRCILAIVCAMFGNSLH